VDGEESKRTLWNRKYEQGLPSLTIPDPFFLSAYDRFAKERFPNGGRALDVAGGLGRHALWLAARDWRVSVVDASEVAIETLHQQTKQRNLKLDLFAIDAAKYTFDTRRYDLVILFYHFDRTLFPKIVSALSPGGLFICKMAIRWDSETPLSGAADNPLKRNELLSLVSDLHVVDHQERPVRDRGVVEFVGTKPVSLTVP
jgi:2-polyprenyl-3-methyl-5-hydroxy-6-metoxy-1,4-benzoquinol methylase